MIHLQRELSITIRETMSTEKRPNNVSMGYSYSVVGYQSGVRKSQDDKPDHEEVRVIYVVNDKGYLQAIYPSLCFFHVDGDRETNSPNG